MTSIKIFMLQTQLDFHITEEVNPVRIWPDNFPSSEQHYQNIVYLKNKYIYIF